MTEWHITEALFGLWVLLRLRRIPGFIRVKKHPECYDYNPKTNTYYRGNDA